MSLTRERLQQLLNYDPTTGVFTWKVAQGKRTDIAGTVAGFDVNGYVGICIDYVKYPAHRLAWLYVHGTWPEHEIDHRDRNRAHNSINNLRPASHHENTMNQSLRPNNNTGEIGVSWDKQTGKWRATITVDAKTLSLGRHASFESAVAARRAGALKHFGDFAPRHP